jgi:hypothetical protein
MKILEFIICVLMFFYVYSSTGQLNSDESVSIIGKSSDKSNLVNIYECGEPLVSCEANFRNLFDNWNEKNICNAETTYSLINFVFVETIIDTNAIDLYANSLTDNNSLASVVHMAILSDDVTDTCRQWIAISSFERLRNRKYTTSGFTLDRIPEMERLFEKEKETLKKEIKSVISVGDKVYSVFLSNRYREPQICSCFVICSHKTNKVIVDNVFRNLYIWCGNSSDKSDLVNIYECGKPLMSCEANFRNLFDNWSKRNICNVETYSLINFAFVETITDTGTIDLYVKSLTDNNSFTSDIIMNRFSINNVVGACDQWITIKPFDVLRNMKDYAIHFSESELLERQRSYEEKKEKLRSKIKSAISIDDKVYSVSFKDQQQTHACFVICSHKTNKVIVDNVFRNLYIWRK